MTTAATMKLTTALCLGTLRPDPVIPIVMVSV
jgi:hypothetical protein